MSFLGFMARRKAPEVFQLGINTTSSSQSTTQTWNYTTSRSGHVVVAVNLHNGGPGTTLPGLTFGGDPMTFRSGQLIATASGGGSAWYSLYGGTIGAGLPLVITPSGTMGRISAAVYEVDPSWDGTIDVFTAVPDTPSDAVVEMTVNLNRWSMALFALGAIQGNWTPSVWTNATKLDEISQGITAGIGSVTAFRKTQGAESSVLITCTGANASANKVMSGIALRNA